MGLSISLHLRLRPVLISPLRHHITIGGTVVILVDRGSQIMTL
jgi:hypothetical protein